MGGMNWRKAADVASREDEGVVVHVRDERGEPMVFERDGEQVPVTITVAGTYSHRYRRVQEAQRDRAAKTARRGLTGNVLRYNQVELAGGCVTAWDGIMDGDQAVPCTTENVHAILDAVPWLLAQVEDAQNDHAGFFKTSSLS